MSALPLVAPVTPAELDVLSRELEGAPPEKILALAAERFGSIAFGTGFGLEGCVLIDVIARHAVSVQLFTLDTGLFFPETYRLWGRLEERYGRAIEAIRPLSTVREQAQAEGEALWDREPERCCALRKLEPLERALNGYAGWVSAIRRDQTEERRSAAVFELDRRTHRVKVNPLLTWSARDVWTYARQHRVPFNPMLEQGYGSIGCEPCTSPILAGEDERAGRWRGRAKKECGLHVAPPAENATSASAATGRAPVDPATEHRAPSTHLPHGVIVWLTGLSGAGKSTLAKALHEKIGLRAEVLDGDEFRAQLTPRLGFSRSERDENVRRIGYVARLLAKKGAVAITAAISPYQEARLDVRRQAEREGISFVEVFVDAEIAALTTRDVKGLYARALKGEIANFTGISDPYERPTAPDVTVRSDLESVDVSLSRILKTLASRGVPEVRS